MNSASALCHCTCKPICTVTRVSIFNCYVGQCYIPNHSKSVANLTVSQFCDDTDQVLKRAKEQINISDQSVDEKLIKL